MPRDLDESLSHISISQFRRLRPGLARISPKVGERGTGLPFCEDRSVQESFRPGGGWRGESIIILCSYSFHHV